MEEEYDAEEENGCEGEQKEKMSQIIRTIIKRKRRRRIRSGRICRRRRRI